ncbi:MAG: hypothetical protein B6U72_05155 [Candidatus Altiarchaeales archaeon ex4484_2]|nr:MAG: hypothetical protein B6U72_05155 [Candidatus Altiarchaeales archaeon ex4484_2]
MITIIIDTNFFMILHKNKIDIVEGIKLLVSEEHRILTFTGVVDELESISKHSRGSDGIAANVALELIKREEIGVVESSGDVDDFIIRYVDEEGSRNIMVCTADAELKKRLMDYGIKFICMHSKNKLGFC